MPYYKNKSNAKKYLLVLAALLLAAGAVFAYQALGDNEEASQRDDSSINFGPPTEEEQRAGDDIKDRIVEEREANSNDNRDTDEKIQANIVVVDADQYDDIIEVRAFISNHVEDGRCNYRFTRGNNTINKSLPAYADASSTICPALEVPRNEFSTAGDWQLVVSYKSSKATGSSESVTLRIN